MKLQMQFKSEEGRYGTEHRLSHLKLMTDEMEYVKFTKQSPQIMAKLEEIIIDIPTEEYLKITSNE